MNARVHLAIDPNPLLSEAQVLDRWPMLSAGVLQRARREKAVTWHKGKRKSAWYRVSDVEAFIERKLKHECRAPENPLCSNSPDNGSPPIPGAPSSIDSGLTPALEEHVAEALAHQI
jgi:hypothetical protein